METHYRVVGKAILDRDVPKFDMVSALGSLGFYNVSQTPFVSQRPEYEGHDAFEFEGWARNVAGVESLKKNIAASHESFQDIHLEVEEKEVF